MSRVTVEDFLGVCKATAQYIAGEKCWHWWFRGMSKNWPGARRDHKTSCAHFVSMCMQRAGILPSGCTIYCRKDGKLMYQGPVSLTKAALEEAFEYIALDQPLSQVELKVGDVLGLYDHKMQHMTIFAGYREDGETTWYDFGSDGTTDSSKTPAFLSYRTKGVFDRVMKVGGNDWGKVSFILRLKEQDGLKV